MERIVRGRPEGDPDISEAVSLDGGFYSDPNLKLIEYIHSKYKEPEENIEATLMKAFEIVGIVKSIPEIQELTQPLEQSGLLPSDQYESKTVDSSDFIDRRDGQLLLELQEGNDERNELLSRVRETTRLRMGLNEEEVSAIRIFGRNYRSHSQDLPPALRVIAVISGLMPTSDQKENVVLEAPPLTTKYATDVYWMMLKQDHEQHKPPIEAAL